MLEVAKAVAACHHFHVATGNVRSDNVLVFTDKGGTLVAERTPARPQDNRKGTRVHEDADVVLLHAPGDVDTKPATEPTATTQTSPVRRLSSSHKHSNSADYSASYALHGGGGATTPTESKLSQGDASSVAVPGTPPRWSPQRHKRSVSVDTGKRASPGGLGDADRVRE